MPGLYRRILVNLTVARKRGPFPVFIHTVLNSLNHRQIGDMLDIWSSSTKLTDVLGIGLADGIIFSTITRIKDGGDDKLLLTTDQQKWVVDELLRLKEIYGNFLCMSKAMIKRLHPDITATQTAETCGTARHVSSYDAAGQKMKQCIFSEKGDCSQCGCVVTSAVETTVKFLPDVSTLLLLGKLYTP